MRKTNILAGMMQHKMRILQNYQKWFRVTMTSKWKCRVRQPYFIGIVYRI